MASITDIKRRILELAPAPFQEFCDTLLVKKGYGAVHGYGMKAGSGNTTSGNPDTYFRKDNGKYIFVAYTIQQSSIYSKLKEDIYKCLDSTKTGLDISDIEEIICCHTSSNLSAGDDQKLHEFCEAKGIALTIWGLDEIANQVHNHYRFLAKNYLGLSIDTNQILSIDDFITQCDANGMSAPLNTVFQYREKEKAEITEALENNSVVIVTGKAGVGKTRLVLETIRSIALTQGCKLLCVKNNNLGLYEDLVSATEQPDKYLFFIDDANELAELSQILAYTTKEYLGYKVKIIVTVRDYAKAKVVTAVKEYALSRMIEIPTFLDDEIKGFINDNLEIRNEDYVKQIVRIAEGNPRIAYMAGRLAVEKQNLSAIKDVSQLYNTYYEKYVNSALGNDKDLCFAAGILSVINAVVLNNMSVLQELLDNYGITSDDFKSQILQLAKLEVVEIQLDQVAALSDQCLANYMLYYVFFQRKIIPLSDVLETGYKHFRNGVIRTVNTILNLFESEETKTYCEQEILKVWDNYKNSHALCFENFVKDFHVFRPEEAFLLAQMKIDGIRNEEFNICNVDFNKNTFCHEESVLEFLGGYQFSDHMNYVMEILLNYSEKNDKTIVSGYKWLENYYGIDLTSYKYKYYTQKKISAYLYDAVSKGNVIAMAIGFQWAKYALAYTFRPTEMGRGNTIVFYNLELKNSEGVREYRQDCWGILITLATKEDWHDKAIMVLDEYASHLQGEPDRDIVIGDIEYVEQLLSALDCNRIIFLKVIQRLLSNGDKMNIKFDRKWSGKYTGKEWELYQLLENDFVSSGLEYKDYEEKRTSQITEYGKSLLKSEIPSLIHSLNDILSDIAIKHEAYNINQGIELIVQQFEEERLHAFVSAFVQLGNNISIRPWTVLKSLNKTSDSTSLLSYLKESNFPQKNDWMFGFFDTLSNEKTTPEMLEEFLQFLHSDSDKSLCSSPYRSLRILDKFISLEPKIYPIACSIIFEKRKYSSFIVEIYFELLFHDQIYSPQELLSLFQSDLDLLQEIYFYILKFGKLEDYAGTFLIEFLLLGETWLQKYSEVFWEHAINHIGHVYHRNNILWKSDNFMMYFDYLFYHFMEEEMYRWKISYAFKDVLTHTENDAIVKQHLQEWLTHIIADNALLDRIGIVFDIVCELSEDIRRDAIKTFLDNNSDFEEFEKLSLVPNHWSGSGSFVPAYQKQIDFLESLYPYVPGVKFLKHKASIIGKVEWLQEMIKREEVEVICRNLYM